MRARGSGKIDLSMLCGVRGAYIKMDGPGFLRGHDLADITDGGMGFCVWGEWGNSGAGGWGGRDGGIGGGGEVDEAAMNFSPQ